MRTLTRHFLASYVGLFAIVLLVSLILMIVIEILVDFDEVVEHREAAGGAVAYLLIRVTSLYLRDLIPAASFIAAFLCLALPARAREVTAIKASGIPLHRIALPLLIAATGFSGLALLVNETVLLETTREFTRLENPGRPIVFGRDSLWYHRGNLFYNVRDADRETQRLHGVKIFGLNEQGRLIESISAEEVRVTEDDRWRLFDATIRRFRPSAPTAPPVTEHRSETVVDMGGRADLLLLAAGEDNLSLLQLLEVIELRRRENREAPRHRAMLHSRLAAPLTVLVFALLAAPLGLWVERSRSVAVSALLGIGLIALFHAAWHVATIFGRSGFGLAATAPWLVLTAFAGLGAWLFVRAPR